MTVNDGHGRIETRKIWITVDLNDYLSFPHVGQAFMIERNVVNQKSGKVSTEKAYGITSKTMDEADCCANSTIYKIIEVTGALKTVVIT